MKVDVSEIKAFRSCQRQWKFSSRNQMHLTATTLPDNLSFGTLFHEALGELYLGVSLDKVLEMVKREADPNHYTTLLAMLKGYAREVLPEDLDRFKVLDIEHHFCFAPKDSNGYYLFDKEVQTDPKTGEVILDEEGNPVMESSVMVCGSIDMIVLDLHTNQIFGFENKTCKSFRDKTFLWMDEQPRVYTYALLQYVEDYNKKHQQEWMEAALEGRSVTETYIPATLGGIYMNEVKKLLRDFQYERTLCVYPEDDLRNFMDAFFGSCAACKQAVDSHSVGAPNPSYFACGMCMFKDLCQTYMYSSVQEAKILEEFAADFQKRTEDHLDEKLERSTE